MTDGADGIGRAVNDRPYEVRRVVGALIERPRTQFIEELTIVN